MNLKVDGSPAAVMHRGFFNPNSTITARFEQESVHVKLHMTYGKPLIYEGKLYSEEHNRSFTTERAGFQVVKDPADKSKLTLVINRQPIGEWFREQFDRLRQSIRQPIQPQRKSRGIT